MKDSFTFFNELILFSNSDDAESQNDMNDDNSYSDHNEKVLQPDQKIINNIMNYSRALSVIRTKRAGNLSILLN